MATKLKVEKKSSNKLPKFAMASGFDAENIKVVDGTIVSQPLVVFKSKGKVHIRCIYEDEAGWKFGKIKAFSPDKIDSVIAALEDMR